MSDEVDRAAGRCELCEAVTDLHVVPIAPRPAGVVACGTCRAWIDGGEVDAGHTFCLQASAWSEVPAVQVLSYRLLKRLDTDAWAADLVDQIYLDDDALAWATALDDHRPTVDSHGTVLADGDSVTLTRDLDVRGANFTAKRGTMVKGIRLGDDPTMVEGRVHKTAIFLKTEFLKKA